MSIRVHTGARLHLGLIDLSAATQRVDGGVGIAINSPSVTVFAEHAQALEIRAPNEFLQMCHLAAQLVRQFTSDTDVKIDVKTDMLPHRGFGSGTQIALAIGRALLQFAKRDDISIPEIAVAVRRGGTSGVGIHSFQGGGLVVDGGRSWPKEKCSLGPSTSFAFATIPPCIARITFPTWGICIIVPDGLSRLHGPAEVQKFKELTPVPLIEVAETSRIILTGILPCAATSDFNGFTQAIDALRNVGMKRRQWSLLGDEGEYWQSVLEGLGFRGISTSSWGPAVFGFTSSLEEAIERAKPLRSQKRLKSLFITTANNHGYATFET